MKKVVKIYSVILICLLFVLSFTTVFGQDLGSSNGLFRASNPKAKKTPTEKKSPPKSSSAKTTAVKKTAKKTTPRRNSASTKQTQIAKKPAKKNSRRQNDIIITVGKTTSSNAGELYEEAIEEGNIARDSRDYTIAESAYRRAKS